MKPLFHVVIGLVLAGCARVSKHSHSASHSTTQSAAARSKDFQHLSAEDQLTFRYRVDGRDAVLESGRVTLVFPDVADAEARTFYFQNGAATIQVGGEGSSEVKVDCRNNEAVTLFRARYANGTNRIEFFDRTVKLADLGRVVITDKETRAISDKTLVHVR